MFPIMTLVWWDASVSRGTGWDTPHPASTNTQPVAHRSVSVSVSPSDLLKIDEGMYEVGWLGGGWWVGSRPVVRAWPEAVSNFLPYLPRFTPPLPHITIRYCEGQSSAFLGSRCCDHIF